MATKIKQMLMGQRLNSNTLFKVIRVCEYTEHFNTCSVTDRRRSQIKRWCRDSCGYSWGISQYVGRSRTDPVKGYISEIYFYVAFSDDQDLLMARFVLDDIKPRPMWETATRFQIFINE